MTGRRSVVGWRLPPELTAAVAEYGRKTGRSATKAAEVLLIRALNAEAQNERNDLLIKEWLAES